MIPTLLILAIPVAMGPDRFQVDIHMLCPGGIMTRGVKCKNIGELTVWVMLGQEVTPAVLILTPLDLMQV
jgi:hypothetical protein